MSRSKQKKNTRTAMPLSVVILAAGQGKRMNSDLPKVLQPLAGRPLLRHVVDTARALSPAALHVVYGHGGEQVRAAFAGDELHWALQAEQKGTGHAVMQAMPAVSDDHMVLVLYGDVPLLKAATLGELLQLAANGLALLTMKVDEPTGYGRIVRDARGRVKAIVEQKDASRAQLKIGECNTGVLAVAAPLLNRWLKRLRSNNAQGEYYLTDIVAMAVKEKVAVHPLVAQSASEVMGVNDKLQLAELVSAPRLPCVQAPRLPIPHASISAESWCWGAMYSWMPMCCSRAAWCWVTGCASGRIACCAM
jgi:bifunctional UDP-N-acetylglucosamine pyrophosphorylase/glucosamine-1-phosphate N-acetyltransferase